MSNVNYPVSALGIYYCTYSTGKAKRVLQPSMIMLQVEAREKTTVYISLPGELQFETCVGYIIVQI